MKCGNIDCRYELMDEEEYFYICPDCGEIIMDSLPEKMTDEKMLMNISGYSNNYKKKIRTMDKIRNSLIGSSLIAEPFMLLISSVLIKTPSLILGSNIFKLTIFMFFIAVLSYKLPKIRIFREVIGDIYPSLYFNLCKWIVYVILIIIFIGFEKGFMYNSLLEKSSVLLSQISLEERKILVSNQVSQEISYIIYVFITCTICDLIGMYKYNLATSINDKIIYDHSH